MNEVELFEYRNATIWRGSSCVFEHLNLSIAQNERVAILGPNGCGKTTLLKTMSREIYPASVSDSSMTILGKENWNVWELRKRIGIVSNDLQTRYTPTTSAIEVVVSGFHSSIGVHGHLAERVSREQVAKARSTLHDLGIGEYGDRQLRHMSTGQQRRCLLARALVHDPDTLLLDEPTAGLDFAASFDYLHRIRELAKCGRNLIIATHHLNEIPPEVDRVVLLKGGKVVADGSKSTVLTETQLSNVYDTAIRVAEIDGYYLAYPAM